MMITKAELERLRSRNQSNNYDVAHLTPHPLTVQQVHWKIERERREAAQHSEERLQAALTELRQNYHLKSRESLAKSQFNSKTQNPSMG